ncbi:hypothetical protein GGI25_006225 [Coemansia spiralis]|uniref:Pre-mRNA-processing factor 19 n=2 Tax=Coemansia TaxID=4863 RepID=A0A9W8KTX8_9FUNG|nr:hypothetical protein EDC05_005798 [Coemansia umbellata]KAJ2619078.1 hypothetical protein GGI26_006105 [Coemansia sp. RSA 1358]KAJ2669228.1 hypothetical protein GGI25_006225 [Coemansia spiralis]
MSFCCSISGEAPTEPVISAKTGRVYEKRLLQKYIDENGREPQTDHQLSEDEIIAVHAEPLAVKPRPPTLTSVPALLYAFQNEWDSLVLETFTLKQQYQQVRQELSQALYQNDAACRVIARLMKESDEARRALATLQAQIGSVAGDGGKAASQVVPAKDNGDEMDVDMKAAAESSKIDKAYEHSSENIYYSKTAETAKILSKSRMKREVPAELTSADAWKTAAQTNVVESLHTSTKPGILTLDFDSSGDLALTGAMDNHAEVYSRRRDQTLATLKGHTKKITAAVWVNGGGLNQRIITGSADKSIRIWAPKPANSEVKDEDEDIDVRSLGWTKECIIKEHAAEIADISLHPCGEYFASAAVDGTWAIHTITGETVISNKLDSPISKIAFHPDGIFLGIVTGDGYAKILDVKQKQILATLEVVGASGSEIDDNEQSKHVSGLHFSENGYYFVTTSSSEVAVWDLRKQKKAHSWVPADFQEGSVVFDAAARFDRSGKYIAIVVGENLHVLKVKGWQQLAKVSLSSDYDSKARSSQPFIHAIAWVGPLSAGVAAVTMYNTLCYVSPANNT